MEHLGSYADLVEAAGRQATLRPPVRPGPALRQAIGSVLGFAGPALTHDVRRETAWEDDDLVGEEVSWSVGYGPRTRAWVLKPRGATGPLPGIVALHSHDGMKTYGKEKIADGPAEPAESVVRVRELEYGGRAYANALARAGFVVVVPDVFLWSSRGIPLATMPERFRTLGRLAAGAPTGSGPAADQAVDQASEKANEQTTEHAYEVAARLHEDLVSKYCGLLGTSFAGVVAYEDRAAVTYLRSRADVAPGPIGCVGLSGGGCRAALLQATSDEIGAAVVVGMMSTHEALLDRLVDGHTWMFMPPGLARVCDWPDLAASRAPSPLLVQYDTEDPLFTLHGMQAADEMIADHYRHAGRPDAYTGQFYEGPHKFDLPMQEAAFGWLADQLR